uniref:Uncharacterized protein n=1 Tax=Megaselia scalaris TaxID=36166 RepID=T1GH49_MEGSC
MSSPPESFGIPDNWLFKTSRGYNLTEAYVEGETAGLLI